jgi:beta propeller repeat protein
MGVVLLSVNLIANTELIQICTAAESQRFPALSGEVAVWQDGRNFATGLDIYGCNPNESLVYEICKAGTDQMYPKISGGVVVWQDGRNAATSGSDIYGFDLNSGLPIEICTAPMAQEFPVISGSIVVWMDNRNSDTCSDLYGYRLDTQEEFVVCRNVGSQDRPAIDGDWVVWMDNRDGYYQIYGCRLEFPIPAEGLTAVRLSPSSASQGFPAVSGDVAVWHDNRNGSTNTDIYGVNLNTFVSFPVCTEAGRQMNPAISGDLVVWQDERNGASRKDIYGYDLPTGNELIISSNNADKAYPAVSGRLVVWEQGGDIWGARLTEPTTLTVVWPDGGEMILAGTEHQILWQTDGPAIEQVRIQFSQDNGQSWQAVEPNVPDSGAYLWRTPIADSQLCRVRVSDIGTSGAADSSNAAFTVFRCAAALTADLTGDCRVNIGDFAVFAAQWLTCGNPYDALWCWD